MGTIQVPGVGTFQVDNSFGSLPGDQQGREVDAMVAQARQTSPPPSPSSNAASLPPGFTLDAHPASSSSTALPTGFILDGHSIASDFDGLASADRGDLTSKLSAALGQGSSPDAIVHQLAAGQAPYAGNLRASLAAGYTPAQVTDHLLGTGGGGLQGAPILEPIARGAAHAMDGIAGLASDVGLTGVGSAIRSRIDQEDLQAPTAGASLSSDLKAGKLGTALGDIPAAALEQVPTLVPALAAGALTGGAADAPLLAAALRSGTAAVLGGATQGDAIARQRAAANGEAAPSTSDLLAGVAGAAGAGAVGSIGLGGVGSGLAGALKAAALRAGGDAAQPELAALAGSAGTKQGATNASPADMAASALTGVATRGALEGPSTIVGLHDALSPAARQAALRTQWATMSPDQQQATIDTAAAGASLKAAQAPGTSGTTLAAPNAAKAAVASLGGGINKLVGTLTDQGVMDDGDKATVTAALKAATSASDNLTPEHLQAISDLELDPATQGSLMGALRAIDRLSGATKPQAPGPIQGALTEAAGPLGGALVGGIGGGPVGALTGAVLGRAARSVLQPALGGLGAKLDGVLGLAKPSLVLDAQRAAGLLQAAGQNVPDNRADLMAAIAGTHDAVAQQARILGLPEGGPAGTAAPAPGSPGSPTGGPPAATPDFGPAFGAMAQQQQQDQVAAAARTPVVSSGGTQGVAPGSLRGSGVTPGGSGDYDPTSPGGLNADAALQAARLPAWTFGLGTALEQALHVSGQARPVNMAGEVGQALDDLEQSGALSQEMVARLKGHNGRVVPLVYGLIRNSMLLRNGIDRRVSDAQTGQAGPLPRSAGVTIPPWPQAAE